MQGLYIFSQFSRLSRLGIAVVFIGGLLACQPIPPRTLVWNGHIYTSDPIRSEVEALVLENGHVLFAGTLADASTLIDPLTADSLDLAGKTVIPGFVESHGHLMGMGRMSFQVNLALATSFEDMIQMVADTAAVRPKGSWIIGRGWHQDKWSDQPEMVQGQPVHTRLSALTPDHPVYLTHASGHSALVNAKAMDLAGIDRETRIGQAGEIYHFSGGEPTGLFSEAAQGLIRSIIPAPTEAEEVAALRAALRSCLRQGVTMFQDAGAGQEDIDRLARLQAEGQLPVRLYVMLHGNDSSLLRDWYARGPLTSDFLTVRSVKLYADGALGSRGAWLLSPYEDRPGHFGNSVMSIDYIGQVAKEGLAHGFQVCTHAIGDRANREVLDRYEAAFQAAPSPSTDHRFRIEHAQHLHPDDIPRFAELGVIASMQGVHLSSDRPWAIDRLGRLRIVQGAYMWQSLLKSGARVINGTDVPVEPLDPIACYYSLVTRKTLVGQPEEGYEPDQKMTREEALRAYTSEGAYGAFSEGKVGSLSPGKWADFVVLSQNIVEAPDSTLLQARVLQTWVAGKPVFVEEHVEVKEEKVVDVGE